MPPLQTPLKERWVFLPCVLLGYLLTACVPIAFLHCNVPRHDYADLHNVNIRYCTIFAADTSWQNKFILFTHIDDGHRLYVRNEWITDTNLPLKGLGQVQSVMVSVLLYLSMPCSCAKFSGVCAASAIRIGDFFLPEFAASETLNGRFLGYVTDDVKNITKFNPVHHFFIAFIRNIGASNLKRSSSGLYV